MGKRFTVSPKARNPANALLACLMLSDRSGRLKEIRERVCQRVCRAVKHFLSNRYIRLVDRYRIVPDKGLGHRLRDPGFVQERGRGAAQGMERQRAWASCAAASGFCRIGLVGPLFPQPRLSQQFAELPGKRAAAAASDNCKGARMQRRYRGLEMDVEGLGGKAACPCHFRPTSAPLYGYPGKMGWRRVRSAFVDSAADIMPRNHRCPRPLRRSLDPKKCSPRCLPVSTTLRGGGTLRSRES